MKELINENIEFPIRTYSDGRNMYHEKVVGIHIVEKVKSRNNEQKTKGKIQ